MRIAIVSDVIYEYISGLAVFTKRLIDELKHYADRVIVITAGTYQKNIEQENVRIYYLKGIMVKKFKFYVGLHSLYSIKKILRKEKIDVVHCMSPLPMAIAAVLHSKRMNIPVIFTSHLQPENVLNNFNIKSLGLQKMLMKYGVWIYNSCDYVTCPSIYAKKELIYYGLRKKSRVFVISNGINASCYKPNHHDHEKMILFVGRIMAEKCIDTLIKASVIVNKKYPEYKFVIAGSGHAKTELKNLASQINPGIIFTGNVPESTLIRLFQSCEIFVLPSESELQGICLLEAMACQKPTIASNSQTSAAGELANILFEHKNHYDLAKKIIYVIENKTYARTIAQKNRELILQEHDYSKVTKKYIALYKNAIQLKNKKRYNNCYNKRIDT